MVRSMFWGIAFLGLVGCDIEEKKTEPVKNALDKKAATGPPDRTPLPEPKEPPTRPSGGLENLPNDVPTANAAEQHNEMAAKAEEDLLNRLDMLRKNLVHNPARFEDTTLDFLSVIEEVRERVTEADGAMRDLTTQMEAYARELKHAAKVYRNASKDFRERARDYKEATLRDRLLDYARDMEKAADAAPQRVSNVNAFLRKLPEMKRKLTESRQFLDDTVRYFKSHPLANGTTDLRKAHSERFRAFFVAFSEIVRTLEEYRQTLRQTSVSHRIHEDFEREQVALQKAEADKQEAERRREEKLVEERRAAEARETKAAKEREETERKLAVEMEAKKTEADRKLAAEKESKMYEEEARRLAAVQPQTPSIPASPLPSSAPTPPVVNAAPPVLHVIHTGAVVPSTSVQGVAICPKCGRPIVPVPTRTTFITQAPPPPFVVRQGYTQVVK